MQQAQNLRLLRRKVGALAAYLQGLLHAQQTGQAHRAITPGQQAQVDLGRPIFSHASSSAKRA